MKHSCILWMGTAAVALVGGSFAEAAVVDLTTPAASGTINGALFEQSITQPAGVGVFQPFLRLQANGTEEGFNTDFRPAPLDDKTAANWTHSVLLSDVGTVNVGGTLYRELALDINQSETAANSKLSLTELKLFVAGSPNLPTLASLGNPVYDLNAGVGGNSVLLDDSLARGLGKSDMIALVPDALFANQNGKYLYLYSKFTNSNAGFEQWTFNQATTPAVPEPSSAVLAVLGFGVVGGIRLRRTIRDRGIAKKSVASPSAL